MPKSIISEGKTTAEAVEKGLKELRVRKDQVEIKVLEQEDKKSFFSILAPRVVKVELILKEGVTEGRSTRTLEGRKEKPYKKEEKREYREPREHREYKEGKREITLDVEQMKQVETKIKDFLDKFIKKLPTPDVTYNVSNDGERINVKLIGENISYLIGYRGEALNSLQVILSSIANRESDERIRILVDIGGYREKRVKTLEELADKISKTVESTGKKVTLEPMTSYERKIIHSKLQENDKIRTYSIGEEPNRKIVVTPNK